MARSDRSGSFLYFLSTSEEPELIEELILLKIVTKYYIDSSYLSISVFVAYIELHLTIDQEVQTIIKLLGLSFLNNKYLIDRLIRSD